MQPRTLWLLYNFLIKEKKYGSHCKKFREERKCCCSLLHPLRGREYRETENTKLTKPAGFSGFLSNRHSA